MITTLASFIVGPGRLDPITVSSIRESKLEAKDYGYIQIRRGLIQSLLKKKPHFEQEGFGDGINRKF